MSMKLHMLGLRVAQSPCYKKGKIPAHILFCLGVTPNPNDGFCHLPPPSNIDYCPRKVKILSLRLFCHQAIKHQKGRSKTLIPFFRVKREFLQKLSLYMPSRSVHRPWDVIYFLKAMTKCFPPDPKSTHSNGPQIL